MNVAQALLHFLARHGCDTLFGVPGYANSLLFLETKGGAQPRPILTKHEGSAAWMAYGYALAGDGRFGACTGTSGPGATNLVTGVVGAFMNSVPLLVLTGQVELSKFGRGAFQELSGQGPRSVDVMKLFGTTTKLNLQLRDAADLPSALEAVREALFTGRKGPVHLNIPVDVLRASVPDGSWSNSGQPALIGASVLAESVRRGALHGAVDEIASALGIARSPLVLFGRGCHGSRELARRFADLSGVPAATTLQGKGVLCGEGDGRYFGVVGTGGSPRANGWVRGPCDLVLAVGTSLGEFTLDGFSPTGLLSKTVIRVDADSREFAKAPFVRANVEADAGEFLALLIDAWEARCKGRAGASGGGRAPHGSADSREARDAREAAFDAFMAEVPVSVPVARDREARGVVAPMDIVAAAQRAFPADAVFVADAGNAAVWAAHYLTLRPGQEFHIDINLASMGSGILSSLGYALAGTGRRVACFVGDGTFFMNGVEISTAADYGIDVTWLVFNDGKLGMVVQGDTNRYGWSEASTFENHDIAALARACGAHAVRVTCVEDLEEALADANKRVGPVVIDVALNDAYLPQVYSRSQKPREAAALVGAAVSADMSESRGESGNQGAEAS